MLTQTEADVLIAMNKTFTNPGQLVILPPGADDSHELVGSDTKEKFMLDLWRGTIRLSKFKYQARGRKVIVLVRLDIDGSPHTNPDGSKIGGTHIHTYQEGYDDKWAYPLNSSIFKNTSNINNTFEDFCNYCNIIVNFPYQRSLL